MRRNLGDPVRRMVTKSVKTDDYSIVENDEGGMIVLGALSAAAKTFTLPATSAAIDGFSMFIKTEAFFNLTLKPYDATSKVWNSGLGYGVELPDYGTTIEIMYDHATVTWEIIGKTGRKVLIEGLTFFEPFKNVGSITTVGVATGTILPDETGNTLGTGSGDLTTNRSGRLFDPSVVSFPGSNDYFSYTSLSDKAFFNILANTTGVKTIGVWIFHTENAGDTVIDFYEDASTYWRLDFGTNLQAQFSIGGVGDIINCETGTFPILQWNHVVLIMYGSLFAIYVNGTQRGFATPTPIDVDGSLYIGATATTTADFTGYVCDMHVSYQNCYGLTPNENGTYGDDTFTAPTVPFQGIMS